MRGYAVALPALAGLLALAGPAAAQPPDPWEEGRLPRCFEIETVRRIVGQPRMSVALEWRDVATGQQRILLRNDARSRWHYLTSYREDGRDYGCIALEGRDLQAAPGPALARATAVIRVPCDQERKTIENRLVTMDGRTGTAISFRDAMTQTLANLPRIGREQGWPAARVQQQQEVVRRAIQALGVPGPAYCAGRAGAGMTLETLLRSLQQGQGYSVRFVGEVSPTPTAVEIMRGARFAIVLTGPRDAQGGQPVLTITTYANGSSRAGEPGVIR